ncbi:hypothetical protein AAL_08408 [Moelleriella libera RCEF 2490]|uniref:Uncharacterized protein n=1 Tax=Moelleriella libera RCEF 2490 TaxID=1081109 RepID=A0A162I163_9HYPO|nr:hypothetical protein AAL_08408 [Moelleriella libera RCEF 2490]
MPRCRSDAASFAASAAPAAPAAEAARRHAAPHQVDTRLPHPDAVAPPHHYPPRPPRHHHHHYHYHYHTVTVSVSVSVSVIRTSNRSRPSHSALLAAGAVPAARPPAGPPPRVLPHPGRPVAARSLWTCGGGMGRAMTMTMTRRTASGRTPTIT